MIFFVAIAAAFFASAAIFVGLLLLAVFSAGVPACLFILNLRRFRPPASAEGNPPSVSVLIPARDEEANISEAISRVLASTGVTLEVVVYDDGSTDRTQEIVRSLAEIDSRVRLLHGVALPHGWNGKQHACARLAEASTAPLLLFLDADVRLEPECIARCVAEQQRTGVALLSGFPRLIAKTSMEWLLLPLIQFVLLGFLPMGRMRKTTKPAYAAGCGQFMLAEREAYFTCGAHAAIRETRHDGLRLPHLFREHGFRTDICDLTELASVRMYCSASGVWNGLAKNATEGLGAPKRIVPLTLLLLAGQVLPLLLAALWAGALVIAVVGALLMGSSPWNRWTALITCIVAAALGTSFLPRLLAVKRFQQPLKSALLHPIGIVLLLCVQWYALVRQIIGRPVGWRSRKYSTRDGAAVGDTD